jgi:predicted MFS family arabinose efflux permease
MTSRRAVSSQSLHVFDAVSPPIADEYFSGPRVWFLLFALLLVSMLCQIDRILPFILAEAIKTDLRLTDTELGLVAGIAFAICYSLMSLPLARFADRGSPRLVLVFCILVWSAMTSMAGMAASFLMLAITRFGVAFGEAGAVPGGHALIVRRVRPELRGMAIGIFSMGIPLGAMVGFAGGGAVSDAYGWRMAFYSAGAIGAVLMLLLFVAAGPTPPQRNNAAHAQPFFRSSLTLLASPAFRWLFIGSVVIGFAAAPFYAFAAPFLIRTYGFTASEVGLSFGLLQGLMGIIGTLVGGAWFDRAVRSGRGRVLGPPAILFLIGSVTTTAALFAPQGWLSIALMVPAMLSFSFLLPWSFGAAHLVAGPGRQAQASSIVMIGSGLFGPALGPVIVGLVSDAATDAGLANGLGLALLLVPIASVLTGLCMLVANHRISVFLQQD